MKIGKKIIFITVAVFVFLSFPLGKTAFSAQFANVNGGTANVRSGPGTTYSVITQLSPGTQVEILEKSEEWTQVKYGTLSGWINNSLLAIQKSNTVVPQVVLDGNKLQFDVDPVIENGRTLVPLRAIFEALGATVDWDDSTRTVTASKGSTKIVLTIGSNQATVNGKVYTLEVPARIINNRTLVPLRFIGEAFEEQVDWDGSTSTITITTPSTGSSASLPAEVWVTGSEVNLRKGPGTTYAKLGLVQFGEGLKVTRQQSGWYQVVYNGQSVWIAGWLVSTSQPQIPAVSRSSLVFLDPGHGGTDTGARGAQVDEKDVNLDVALRVGKILQQSGIEVAYSRTEDVFVSLEEESAMANRLNAGVFVSIHCNSSSTTTASGTETYFYAPESSYWLYAQRDERYRLASCLQTQLINKLQRFDRGVKKGNLSVLRNTIMPSALVEMAFISNTNEQYLLMQDVFKDQAAQAIADGIIAYMQS